MIDGARLRMTRWRIPMKAPIRKMFSRPEISISNPAPSVSRDETRPLSVMDPSSGARIPASASRSVLLPAPFWPRIPSDSPCWILKSTWRSAQKWLPTCCLRPTHSASDPLSVVRRVRLRL